MSMMLNQQQPYVKVYLFRLILTGGNSLKYGIALKKEHHIVWMHRKGLAMIWIVTGIIMCAEFGGWMLSLREIRRAI
ncbi:MAG: hypothetical protein CME72_03350 [Halomonadaceae bacterium]|nr:hypothetical protein [Halomonadaceae bacterium]